MVTRNNIGGDAGKLKQKSSRKIPSPIGPSASKSSSGSERPRSGDSILEFRTKGGSDLRGGHDSVVRRPDSNNSNCIFMFCYA